MRVELFPPDSDTEPRHWVRHDQAFAMMLGPGSIEWGSKRSALEKFDYAAGDLALCHRHEGEWVGFMNVPQRCGHVHTRSDPALHLIVHTRAIALTTAFPSPMPALRNFLLSAKSLRSISTNFSISTSRERCSRYKRPFLS